MAENLLVLVPAQIDALPERDPLVQALQAEQFIAAAFSDGLSYRPGNEFMMLVTFLGCSPTIYSDVEDETSEQFCRIRFVGPTETQQISVADNVKVPRCPDCGHRFEDWRDKGVAEVFVCPGCNKPQTLDRLRWRKCAGFGRFFIEISGIFESEAVPSPNLLALLKRLTGFDWHHFFLRRN